MVFFKRIDSSPAKFTADINLRTDLGFDNIGDDEGSGWQNFYWK